MIFDICREYNIPEETFTLPLSDIVPFIYGESFEIDQDELKCLRDEFPELTLGIYWASFLSGVLGAWIGAYVGTLVTVLLASALPFLIPEVVALVLIVIIQIGIGIFTGKKTHDILKEQISKSVLPKFIRNGVSDEKIEHLLEDSASKLKPEFEQKIYDGISKEWTTKMSDSIKKNIIARANQIVANLNKKISASD